MEALKSSRKDVVRAVYGHGGRRTMQRPQQAGQIWRRKLRKTGRTGLESQGAKPLPRVESNGNAEPREKGVASAEPANVGVLHRQV